MFLWVTERCECVWNGLVSAFFLVCAVLFAGVASLKHFHRHLLVAYNTESLSSEREGQLLSGVFMMQMFLSVCKCSDWRAVRRRYLCLRTTVTEASDNGVTWRIILNDETQES